MTVYLKNNQGFTFAYQGDLSIRVQDQGGQDLGEVPWIYLNDLEIDERQKFQQSNEAERHQLVRQLIEKRFLLNSLSISEGAQNRTYQVQCYNYDHKPFIVFEKYGLQGGGFKALFTGAISASQIAGGILIGVGFVGATALTGGTAPIIAAALVASGASGLAYSYITPEKNINAKDFAKRSAIGAATGGAGGAATLAVTAGIAIATGATATLAATTATSTAVAVNNAVQISAPFIAPLATGAAAAASGTAAGAIAEAVIEDDGTIIQRRITRGGLVRSAAVGAITGGVSTLTQGVVTGNLSNALNSARGNPIANLGMQTTVSAAAGAASGSAVRITENVLSKFQFLQICYRAVPDAREMVPGKLYVFVHNQAMHFISITAQGQKITTTISRQDQFGLPFDSETRLEELMRILNSDGRSQFNDRQKQFILESAERANHRSLGIFEGVGQAATLGASTGALTGFTKAAVENTRTLAPSASLMRKPEEQPKPKDTQPKDTTPQKTRKLNQREMVHLKDLTE